MISKIYLEIILEKLYLILPKNIREDLAKPIKQDLDKLEKLEKVIEILKRFISIKEVKEGMCFINSYVINELLTKEEYDLLKEVIKDD